MLHSGTRSGESKKETCGEILNWKRLSVLEGSGYLPQDTTDRLVKQQKCIYLITVLEAGKSMVTGLARSHSECSSLGMQATTPSLCAHLAF